MRSFEKRYYSSTKPINENNKVKGQPDKAFNTIFNTPYRNPYTDLGEQKLRTLCMNCGKEHRKRVCPVCGSMAVRLG